MKRHLLRPPRPGVSSSLTVYGGMQAASRYRALSTGLGYNLGEPGAASADVTRVVKKKDDEKTSGQSRAYVTEKHRRNRHQRHHRGLPLLYPRV